MRLTQLKINDFRNLRDTGIEPVYGVNLITGDNASGKTSLLESIYYLSHVRSFRTRLATDLINRDAQHLQLFARIDASDSRHWPIGIRRSRDRLEVRADQQPVQRISEIAARFPVLAIHPDSYKLITGSPEQRRQYLDWGVFHVEHSFLSTWQRYKKALAQRNAALRTGQATAQCIAWDPELVQAAEHIDRVRSHYIEQLKPYFNALTGRFFPGQQVRVAYRRGWAREFSLSALLQERLAQDRSRGYTCAGPHRADLTLTVDDQSAQTGISRGQQKTLVALLRLAQAQQFTEHTGRMCVLLYDDLAAELDAEHRAMILSVLADMNVQLFVTAIEPEQIDISGWREKKKFHVEHGRFQELI